MLVCDREVIFVCIVVFVFVGIVGLLLLGQEFKVEMNIFVVEDDIVVVDFFCKGLCEEGYLVDVCVDGREGFQLVMVNFYDVFIIDCFLFSFDGFGLICVLCVVEEQMLIFILSVLVDVVERVKGLSLGVDDYFVKLFVFFEFLVCVMILVKRVVLQQCDLVEFEVGDFMFDLFS